MGCVLLLPLRNSERPAPNEFPLRLRENRARETRELFVARYRTRAGGLHISAETSRHVRSVVEIAMVHPLFPVAPAGLPRHSLRRRAPRYSRRPTSGNAEGFR